MGRDRSIKAVYAVFTEAVRFRDPYCRVLLFTSGRCTVSGIGELSVAGAGDALLIGPETPCELRPACPSEAFVITFLPESVPVSPSDNGAMCPAFTALWDEDAGGVLFPRVTEHIRQLAREMAEEASGPDLLSAPVLRMDLGALLCGLASSVPAVTSADLSA